MEKLFVLLTILSLLASSSGFAGTRSDVPMPTAICQTATIHLGSNGQALLEPEQVDGGSFSPEGSVSLSVSPESFTCNELGTQSVTLTATDTNGQSSLCETTITVADNLPPTLLCPLLVINLDPGACQAEISAPAGLGDNCGPVTLTQVNDPGLQWDDPLPIGTHLFELEASDPAGNTSSCTWEVSILEYPNPVAALTCNNQVLVSLGPDGTAELWAGDFLEGGPYGCYENYTVEVLNEFGNSMGSTVDCDFIGPSWTAVITDPATTNQCWSTFQVEDKIPPVFSCPVAPISIPCADPLQELPPPIVEDNCTPVIIELAGQYETDPDICDDSLKVVVQEWIATDEYGNTSEPCLRSIEITRPWDIDFPDDLVWDCTTYDAYPTILDPAPYTGDPTTSGSGIPGAGSIDSPHCAYQYAHADEVLQGCGNSFKVIRTWTVFDWCTNSVILTNEEEEDNVQQITIMDATGPVLELPPTWTVSAEEAGEYPVPCYSLGDVPGPLLVDDCGASTVRIFTPVGEASYTNGENGLEGGSIPTPGLPLGEHPITYIAEDDCGNMTETVLLIEVVDDIAPTPICDEITEVVLSSNGLAVVAAEVFDDGSYDNCCLESLQVRRMDGDCQGNEDDFAPEVVFCCEDVGTPPVTVIFRALDCHGNYNDCMVTVEVQDKQPPILLSCPEDVSIDCKTYLEDYAAGVEQDDYSVLEPLGTATYQDNCDLNITQTLAVDIDNCSSGKLVRTWTAEDPAGNVAPTCTQTIDVKHVSDWVVEFPANLNFDCLDIKIGEFGEPEIFFDDCELIAASYEETVFTVVPDACIKIERIWTVINWCIYEDFGEDAFPEAGFAECDIQVDLDGDGDMDCRTFQDGINAEQIPDGYIQYQQTIKLVDNQAPDVTLPEVDGCIVGSDCTLDLVIPYPEIWDACSEEFRVDVSSAEFGDFDDIPLEGILIPAVEAGTYTFQFSTTDECGNTNYQTLEVEVEDCKAPTLYCKDLVVEIMPNGMIEVPADAFDAGSFDNCDDSLVFSFTAEVTDTVFLFDCQYLSLNTVTIWATDDNGNQDFCVTEILIQDNLDNCVFFPIVSGQIFTEEALPVEGAAIQVNGANSGEWSDPNGAYAVELESGNDYTIAPVYDGDPLEGITTFDLVLISRHILGVTPLESPYQIIAADVNNSESVTTLDLVYLQKLILHLISEFPNNTSWRFVDAAYEFPIPTQPFQSGFPEFASFNNLTAHQDEVDFVAVKTGDVNGTALSIGGDSQDRSQEVVLRRASDAQGERLWLEASKPLAGAQLVLEVTGQANFTPDAFLPEESWRWEPQPTGGRLWLSWVDDQAASSTLPLGTLTGVIQSAALTEDLLKAEAYSSDLQQYPIRSLEESGVASPSLKVAPNPFVDRFILEWDNPVAGEVHLEIFRSDGSLIMAERYQAAAGQQSLEVPLSGASGLLLLRLRDEWGQMIGSIRVMGH